jgi:hypothetical protein
MSKKTRQMVTLLVLCLLLVAAGVGYYCLTRYQAAQEQEEDADEEETSLYDLSSDDIKKLSFVRDKTTLSFVKQKSKWKLEKDKKYPLNQDTITEMVDEMTGATVEQVVTEDCDDLSSYDLDTPELTISVTDSSGEEKTLYVGMESLSGGGRYAYCEGEENKIYLLSTSIYTGFNYSLEDLMEVAEIPTVNAEKVTYINVSAKKGDNFEALYDKKNSPYKDIYSWEIDQPYSQPVAGDQDELQGLFENYAELTFSGGVTYKTSDSLSKKYGLTDPAYDITIKTAKKTVQLTIGNETEDGSGYYAALKGTDGIYIMSADTVSSITTITAMDYVYQRLYAGSQETLTKMDLTYNGKSYSYQITKKKTESDSDDEDDDSDSEEYTYTVKSKGKKVDSDDFFDAFSDVSNLNPNGEIDSSVKVTGNDKVAEFTFYEGKKTTTLTVYPYDGNNFYRIKVGDVMQFVVDMRTIDDIIEDFTSLK